METGMALRAEVMDHLSQMFDEIDAAIRSCPGDLWRREGVKGMMVPAVLARHMVWCIRLGHLLDIPRDQLPGGQDAGTRVPSQEQLIGVLDAIRSCSARVYGRLPDEAYLMKKGTGSPAISRVMYTIAHTRHHLGQFVQILKENGIPPPKWYPR